MKKALIIGGAGFVGGYLIRELIAAGDYQVAVTKLSQEEIPGNGFEVFDLNILNSNEIEALLGKYRPDCIFHLAAQSSVYVSWQKPGMTIDVNVKGSVNVLDVVRKMDAQPRILLVGSSEEYGRILSNEIPVTETNAVRPVNIYAATKVCQNLIGKIYADAYGMKIMSVRAFNHIGPNQAPMFVVSDFCRQAARIECGLQEPVIRVGNLKAKRDFTDVRDVVYAYRLLMEKGEPGETYNVGSGEAVEIDRILQMILKMSRTDIRVEVDAEKFRPLDVPVIAADTGKLRDCTGWTRKISLEQTLEETLGYWREKMKNEDSVLQRAEG